MHPYPHVNSFVPWKVRHTIFRVGSGKLIPVSNDTIHSVELRLAAATADLAIATAIHNSRETK